MSRILRHVELQSIADDQIEVAAQFFKRIIIVLTLHWFLLHDCETHRMRYNWVVEGNRLVCWLCEKLSFIEYYQTIDDLYINFSHLNNSTQRTKIGIAGGGILDDSDILGIAYLMHPFEAVLMAALDPLHGAATLLLLHADVAVVVGLDFIWAFATVELVVHYQVLIVLKFVRTHLALQARLADVLICCWAWLGAGLHNRTRLR